MSLIFSTISLLWIVLPFVLHVTVLSCVKMFAISSSPSRPLSTQGAALLASWFTASPVPWRQGIQEFEGCNAAPEPVRCRTHKYKHVWTGLDIHREPCIPRSTGKKKSWRFLNSQKKLASQKKSVSNKKRRFTFLVMFSWNPAAQLQFLLCGLKYDEDSY